jgi:hypothetical protein
MGLLFQNAVIPRKRGIQAEQRRGPASQTVCRRNATTNPLRGKFLHSQKLGTALQRCDDSLEF